MVKNPSIIRAATLQSTNSTVLDYRRSCGISDATRMDEKVKSEIGEGEEEKSGVGVRSRCFCLYVWWVSSPSLGKVVLFTAAIEKEEEEEVGKSRAIKSRRQGGFFREVRLLLLEGNFAGLRAAIKPDYAARLGGNGGIKERPGFQRVLSTFMPRGNLCTAFFSLLFYRLA